MNDYPIKRGWMLPHEAAERLGLTVESVMAYAANAKEGVGTQLPGVRVGRQMFFSETVVRDYEKNRRPRGRPALAK